jgi:hypothetical protein
VSGWLGLAGTIWAREKVSREEAWLGVTGWGWLGVTGWGWLGVARGGEESRQLREREQKLK